MAADEARAVTDRDFDVVVLGSTGVTGREVCRYLAGREPPVRWAAAGRSPERISAALSEIDTVAPATLAADVGDVRSLVAVAARTRVLLNLVGPFVNSADAVVSACVEAGTDYVDLTGETPLMRRIQDRFGEAARGADVKIVQACGFEALPPDMAIRLAAVAASDRYGEQIASADVEIEFVRVPRLPRPSDIVSGGTMQSLVEVLRDPDARSVADPALLISDPDRAAAVRARSPLKLRPRRGTTGAAIAPLVPAASINPPVVQRTAELAGDPVLRYREGLRLPGGTAFALPGLLVSGAVAGAYLGLFGLTRMASARRTRVSERLRHALPGTGFGPASERIGQFAWTLSLLAHTTRGHHLRVQVEGAGHPGYLTTATMMGEAGALVAEPGQTPERSGCLTPAIALGTGCASRFAPAGLQFTVI